MTCPCGRPLTFRQRKYCSRSCAGKGIPLEMRQRACRKAVAASTKRHWAAIWDELRALPFEEAIRRAYWLGYAAHRMRERRKAAA